MHADTIYCWLTGQPAPKVNAGAPTPPVEKGLLSMSEADKAFEKLGRTAAEKPGAGSIDPRTLEFANAGEFYAACWKYRSYSKTEIDHELKAKYNLAHPVQRAEAWQFILGLPVKKQGGAG